MSLVSFDGPTILLVPLDVDFLEVVVETLLNGALIVWDIKRKHKTWVKCDWRWPRPINIELISDDSSKDVSDDAVGDV